MFIQNLKVIMKNLASTCLSETLTNNKINSIRAMLVTLEPCACVFVCVYVCVCVCVCTACISTASWRFTQFCVHCTGTIQVKTFFLESSCSGVRVMLSLQEKNWVKRPLLLIIAQAFSTIQTSTNWDVLFCMPPVGKRGQLTPKCVSDTRGTVFKLFL